MSVAGAVERVEFAELGPALRALPAAAQPSGPPTLADRTRHPDRPTLSVLPALAPLLPGGMLRRGSTVMVTGSTALALALLAGPSQAGAWCAVVGVPTLGARAAVELGVRPERLALIPAPGTSWSATVAALFDGVDVVAVRPPGRVSGGEARRLMARARERGTTLVPLGPWEGADLRLAVSDPQWTGIADGVGRLHARRLQIRAEGRGSAARGRQATIWLPAEGGGVAPAEEQASPSLVAVPDSGVAS